MGLKRKNKISAEFSMSSLTDVIFLLLIFFMLTSSLVTPNALNVTLPSANSSVSATSPLAVQVDDNGTFYWDNKKVSKSTLRTKLRQAIKKRKRNTENVTVTINADKEATIDNLVYLMELIKEFKGQAILATKKK